MKKVILVLVLALTLVTTTVTAAGPFDGPSCRAWFGSGGYAVWAMPGCLAEIMMYYWATGDSDGPLG